MRVSDVGCRIGVLCVNLVRFHPSNHGLAMEGSVSVMLDRSFDELQ